MVPFTVYWVINYQLSIKKITPKDLGPTSIINEENAPKEMPLLRFDEDNSPVETLWVTLGCVRLTAEASYGKHHSGKSNQEKERKGPQQERRKVSFPPFVSII